MLSGVWGQGPRLCLGPARAVEVEEVIPRSFARRGLGEDTAVDTFVRALWAGR